MQSPDITDATRLLQQAAAVLLDYSEIGNAALQAAALPVAKSEVTRILEAANRFLAKA